MPNGYLDYTYPPRFMWDVGAGENEIKLIVENLLKARQRIQTGPGGETYYGRVPGGVTFGWRSPDTIKSPLDKVGDKYRSPWRPGEYLGLISGKVSEATGISKTTERISKTIEQVKIAAIGIGIVAVFAAGVAVAYKLRPATPQVVVVPQTAPATEVKKSSR